VRGGVFRFGVFGVGAYVPLWIGGVREHTIVSSFWGGLPFSKSSSFGWVVIMRWEGVVPLFWVGSMCRGAGWCVWYIRSSTFLVRGCSSEVSVFGRRLF
jgi:hypothetical protein